MELLRTFAALSLAAGAVMALLPDGSLRRTAGMVIGLVMLMCWAEGLGALLRHPLNAVLPETVLAPAAADVASAEADTVQRLLTKWEGSP